MHLPHGEVPASLARAHNDGDLVLFVGAGASKPEPSAIPDFRRLAKRVIARLGSDRKLRKKDAPEDVLSELADRGLSVHRAVHEIVAGSPRPNEAHRAIASLAVAGPAARIVTTNYDRHLTSALAQLRSEELRVFDGPDVPGEPGFDGVVHIHGSVAQPPWRLVVTKRDFARAYMQPLSPTLAFLHRVFVSKTVLFIGYSANDTLMQYILQADLGRARLYALTRRPHDATWEQHGISPVGYADHDDLPLLLSEWARAAAFTPEDHSQRVRRIVSRPRTDERLSQADESYLAGIVADADLVRHFTDQARGPYWIRWLAERPGSPLFGSAPAPKAADRRLMWWLAERCCDDDESAAETLRQIERRDGELSDLAWFRLFGPRLLRRGASVEAAGRLLVALAEAVPASQRRRRARAISAVLARAEALPDDAVVELAVSWAAASTDAVCPPSGPCALRELWHDRPHIAEDLLGIVDTHLRRFCRNRAIAGDADPFASRAAIGDHDQNPPPHPGDLLVDAARDLTASLLPTRPDTADAYLLLWSRSSWTILNRLAVHGWTHRDDVTARDKLGWLLERDRRGWISRVDLHHEVMGLLAAALPRSSDDDIEAVIGLARQGTQPGHERAAFARLAWIAEHAPHSPPAQEAFQSAQAAHRDWTPPAQPDLLTQLGPAAGEPGGLSVTVSILPSLADELADDPRSAISSLASLADAPGGDEPIPHRLAPELRIVADWAQQSPHAGVGLLRTLIDEPDVDVHLGSCVAETVLDALCGSPDYRPESPEEQTSAWELMVALWAHGKDRWPSPQPIGTAHDPTLAAPGGWRSKLIDLAAHVLTHRRDLSSLDADGMPRQAQELLEDAVAGSDPNSLLAQIAAARWLPLLHSMSRDWANRHLLPLLDAAVDAQRSLRCWQGAMSSAPWTEELLSDGLLDRFVALAEPAAACDSEFRQACSRRAADICLSTGQSEATQPRDWLTRFESRASDEMRVDFVRAVTQRLREEPPNAASEQWSRWMRDHWQRRLTDIPRPLTDAEASALADWVALLDRDLPDAVSLATSYPTPLQRDSILPEMLDAMREGHHPNPAVVDRHADDIAKLVAHMLAYTDAATAQELALYLPELILRLSEHADETAFEPLKEQASNHGWPTEPPQHPATDQSAERRSARPE